MAKLTTDEIIDALKEMTLLEASELVKAIEDTFGVSAAAPASGVAAPAALTCSSKRDADYTRLSNMGQKQKDGARNANPVCKEIWRESLIT